MSLSPGTREQGMPDAHCTRGLVCKRQKKTAHEHTGQRRQSDIPCAMALRLISRSPRSVGLSCLRRFTVTGTPARLGFRTSANLTPTSEASGPHDFAVRIGIVRLARRAPLTENPPCEPTLRPIPRRPPHPIPTFGDDSQRPFLGNRMAGVVKVICPTAKGKFCPSGYFVAVQGMAGIDLNLSPQAGRGD
jgi:hypothetical protein